MSFIYVADGIDDVLAAHLNQYADAWSGVAGKGQPFNAVAVNDPINFAISARNLDPTNSRACQFLKADGTVLFQVDASGVKVSPDGTVAGVPVTVNATQTLTNKTFVNPTFSPALNQRARAVGATGGPTTASTTYVDLTDLAVTLTTTGGDLLCWAVCDVSNSLAGSYDYLAFSLDAAVEVGEQIHNMTTANAIYSLSCVWLYTGVSAAVHTVKARWHVDSGTGTANGIRRQMVVVELKS